MSFRHCDFFVLRNPLLPVARLAELHAAVAPVDNADVEAAFAAGRQAVADRLMRLADDAVVYEALWFASPGLAERLRAAESAEPKLKDEEMLVTLYKYFVRMTSRCTPFGLFASCGMGRIGTSTELQQRDAARRSRVTRLDTEYIYTLVASINADRALRSVLRYRANSGIYAAGDRLHYPEVRNAGKPQGISYKLSAVDTTDYLHATLSRAAVPVSIDSLARALVLDDAELTIDDCLEFIHDLIDNQLLIPEITPAVTGGDPLSAIIAELASHKDAEPWVSKLESAQMALAQIDAAGLGGDTAAYQRIIGTLKALPVAVQEQHLFQVDAYAQGALTIDQRFADAIRDGVELLASISDRYPSEQLVAFKRAFRDRYEGQEIPLCEALDDDIGIGFGGNPAALEPLLQGIQIGGAGGQRGGAMWSTRDLALLDRIQRMERRQDNVLTLDAELIDAMRSQQNVPLPDAWSAFVSILGTRHDSAGDCSFHLKSATGPGAANLIGRFCHLDPELEAAARDCLRREEALQPDRIYAEIAHMPEGRMGNILRRPVLRDHEIVYLCSSEVSEEDRIGVQDLMVSVVGEQILLRSARSGKFIVPRLASAHNFMRGDNLSLYRFLCLLQGDGVHGAVMWDWGGLSALDFLPRVVHKRMVLAAACWRLRGDEIKLLLAASGRKQFQAVQALREKLGLPGKVRVSEGDNDMVFDLDSPFSCEMFCRHLQKYKHGITVQESLQDEYGYAVGIAGQTYANEIVVPFVRTAA